MTMIFKGNFVLCVRCNILTFEIQKIAPNTLLKLFQSYCRCFYDIALWTSFTKVYKTIFGYRKCDSVTSTLLETVLPVYSFDTVSHNAKRSFHIDDQ